MERVINRMYEIEEKANGIINRTSDQKQKLLDQHNKAIEQLKIDIAQDSEKKLSALRLNMENEIMNERTILTQECTRDLNALESNYNETHDELVDGVFRKIITSTY